MKRGAPEDLVEVNEERPIKRRSTAQLDAKGHFRPGLFDETELKQNTSAYHLANPYKHGVISDLLSLELIRNVRQEIQANISFSEKETDIYKIYQSGDLANLDGLDDSALELLPSLVTLRDALYSRPFRNYLSSVTGSGPLSGRKTDMAVNVYTPGCHLLCHDDVIGSRRVSYILYLTDPDDPWQSTWGGALRLYPTEKMCSENGREARVPNPEFSRSIPPAFNQLSFFAVQPGESFHDVEEVYSAVDENDNVKGVRTRMAISGWFHIPQFGEEGFEEGAEQQHAAKSSLAQLEGDVDAFDLPHPRWIIHDDISEKNVEENDRDDFSEADLNLLLRFMNPNYLVPEAVSDLANEFEENPAQRLERFLSPKAETALRDAIAESEHNKQSVKDWTVARPPHKHRFLFRQPKPASRPKDGLDESLRLVEQLINEFFPSVAFRKWLQLASGLSLGDCNVLARRFRRGQDYTLATAHTEVNPRLEITLGLTTWGEEEEDEDRAASEGEEADDSAQSDNESVTRGNNTDLKENAQANGSSNTATTNGPVGESDGHLPAQEEPIIESAATSEAGVGGYEVYMQGDDEEEVELDDDTGSDHGVPVPSSHTGAGKRREKADPAIYKSSSGGDDEAEDDGILFSMPPCWNVLSLVLRDKGCLRFTKYLSRSAPGDRWDVIGEWKVESGEDEDKDSVENGDGELVG